jgi:hypothetical protein
MLWISRRMLLLLLLLLTCGVSRFHELSEFDDVKRSCRLRLAGHNERRRKSSADAHGGGGGGNGFRQHSDQNGPAGNHFQIR